MNPIQNLPLKFWMSKLPINVTNLFVGIDPGKNLGLSYIIGAEIVAAYVRLPEKDKFAGVNAKNYMDYLVANLFNYSVKRFALVEGAAYNKIFGQDLLAQIRFGLLYSLKMNNFEVDYIPPATARKNSFENGKISGSSIWKKLNANAADAAGIAIACLMKHQKYWE